MATEADVDDRVETAAGTVPAQDFSGILLPELVALESSESKSGGSLTLLIVTVILFFSSQIISVKWQEIFILILVLFLHELGHLAAMKLFRYRDVKMFFIPFIGAAVSGKSGSDTAVKSCFVSLMGPLPGIMLGLLLFFLFLPTKSYYIYKTSEVMIILNAFNLLPMMPLDGGRYIDVLFVNRRTFRLLFALAGAMLFLCLALATKDIILGIIGAFTLFTATSNFKLHGICDELKSQGVVASSFNELVQDEKSYRMAMDSLRTRFPRLFSPTPSRQAILDHLNAIVGTIKFNAAGVLSKLGLLLLYAIILPASLLLAVLIVATDYKEVLISKELDGKKQMVVERHLFGQKRSECPVDSDLLLDGKGIGFAQDGSVSDEFHYSKGFRTGEWLSMDEDGRVTERKTYDKGRLLRISELEEGGWRSCETKDLPWLRRFLEEIQRMSQPYASNHKHFD